MSYQPFIEFYQKHRCPECEVTNWTYHSHSERSEPIRDPEVCQCWGCEEKYWLMSEEAVMDYYGSYLEDCQESEFMEECGADIAKGKPFVI